VCVLGGRGGVGEKEYSITLNATILYEITFIEQHINKNTSHH
jgi:hypothetical protein